MRVYVCVLFGEREDVTVCVCVNVSVRLLLCVLIDACIGDIIKVVMFGRISFAQSLHCTTLHCTALSLVYCSVV